MPRAAPRPCTYPGCGALVDGGGRCDKHRAQIRREVDERRGSSRERGYSGAWEKARAGYLRCHPLCVRCSERGLIIPATVVDHIRDHKGDPALFWDESNWQALCKPCHDRKPKKMVTSVSEGGRSNL